MAEENKTPVQAKKNWFQKLIGWFASLPGRIATAFKNMVAELRKVTWPSRKKLISSSIIVLLFMLISGVAVALLDVGSAALVNGAYKMTHPATASGYDITEDESLIDSTVEEEDHTGHDHGEEVPETTEDPVETEPTTETETPAAE